MTRYVGIVQQGATPTRAVGGVQTSRYDAKGLADQEARRLNDQATDETLAWTADVLDIQEDMCDQPRSADMEGASRTSGQRVEFSRQPDLDDQVQEYVHRVIEACKKEFADDPQVPRFVVIAECPPDGRIGIATTADDAIDAHRLLTMGAASARNAMDPETKRKAREYWAKARAAISEGIDPPPYGPPRG